MQRFEMTEGTANKFWEVDVSGNDLTVRFGRVGTAGQSKTKNFDSSAAAIKERDKLIKEKTGKGYAAVVLAAGAALPPVAAPAKAVAPAAPAPAKKKAAVAMAVIDAVAASDAASTNDPVQEAAPVLPSVTPSSAATANSPIAWPTGGFIWSEKWNKLLPVVRGIHTLPASSGLSLLSNLISLPNDGNRRYQDTLTTLGSMVGRTWTYWGEAESKVRITRQALQAADFEYWLELVAQDIAGRGANGTWITSVGIGLHGLPFILEVVLTLCQDALHYFRRWHFPILRQDIAAAYETQYQLAHEVASRMRSQGPSVAIACAHLFPHIQEWTLEAIPLAAGGSDNQSFLDSSAMPAATALSFFKGRVTYVEYYYAALLLQIKLHGEQAFPLLRQVLFGTATKYEIEHALELFLDMRVPEMIDALVSRIDQREICAALNVVAEQFPAAALKTAIEQAQSSRSRTIESWAVRLALRKPELLPQVLPALDASSSTRFQALLAEFEREEASAEQLPELLRNPPWLQKTRQQELPVLKIAPIPTVERLEWEPEQIQKYAAYRRQGVEDEAAKAGNRERHFLNKLFIRESSHANILQGSALQAEDIVPSSEREKPRWGYSYEMPHYVLFLPPQPALAIWNGFPWNNHSYCDDATFRAILCKFGTSAIPGFANVIPSFSEMGLQVAAHVDSPQIVPVVLHTLRNLKKAQTLAIDWIKRHPATTLMAALPLAFGENKTARENAQFAVRWMLNNGFDTQAEQAANEYGPAMNDALAALRSQDPLAILPVRMPKMPSFFVPAAFRRPQVKNVAALPVASAIHIGTILALSKLDAPYAGLEVLRNTCSADSLAEFSWDLFEAWMADGAPNKESWAFLALGLLGNDETARRLAPKIREWPGEGAHARAVVGLDLLATIGSDVALMHLNGIAAKVKFKGLQERAKEKIATVAEARGFTPEELADRLVPDLGLDENGTLELDFGPRKFYVSFDETLKPFVKDATGVRLKDLPKAVKTDDAALAEAATDCYKQLKKDSKAIASLQLMRMEMSMVMRRRWSSENFNLLFLDHPLMRYLSARVVWGVYVDGALTQSFRVAEDWTLADENDETFVLPDTATVGIAHVLEIPAATLAAFGQVFADYEILQPFKQLGRETFALHAGEEGLSVLTRYANKQVAIGSIMGLTNRGWERGAAQDAGWIGWFSKPCGPNLRVDLGLDPGTIIGDPTYEPKQKLPTVTLRKADSDSWTRSKDGLVPFSRLDPILLSEVLRDIELLAPLVE